MKVLAINTSPEREKGNTCLLLDPYIEGMRDSGAEVEVCNTNDIFIFPCCGNIKCTLKTPGKCMQYDDMKWLRPKISDADVLVLASPVYCDGAMGPEGATDALRSLLQRLEPGENAINESAEGPVIRPPEVDVALRKVVLASNCGFWEIDEFYPVLTHVKAFCMNAYPTLDGTVFQPYGVHLRGVLTGTMSRKEIIEAARAAGRHLILEDSRSTYHEDLKRHRHLAREVTFRIINKNAMELRQ